MIRRIVVLLAVTMSTAAVGQTPDLLNYQGVLRDGAGVPMVNRNVGVQFRLRQGSAGGTQVFEESQTVTTNGLGLFSTQIGLANPGAFSQINWEGGILFLEVGVDTTGGSSFISLGTQQLVSAPYAIHARTAEKVASSFTNNILSIAGVSYTLPSQVVYTGGNGIAVNAGVIDNTAPDQTVTIGTTGNNVTVSGTYPNFNVASSATLTHTDGQLSISDGNTVNIAPTLSIQSGVLRVGPQTNTVPLPAQQQPTISGIGAAVVSPTTGNSFTVAVPQPTLTGGGVTTVNNNFPNYSVSTPSAVLNGSGAVQVNSAFPNYTVYTPSVTVAGTGISTVSGPFPNYVVNTPSPVITATGASTVVPGTYPNYVINTGTPNITGTGAATVSGNFPNYFVNSFTTSVSASGLSTISGIWPNYTVQTNPPLLTFTNNILTAGPASNSVLMVASPWTQTATSVMLTSTNVTGVAVGPANPGVVTGSSRYLTVSSTNTYGSSPVALELQGSATGFANEMGKIDFVAVSPSPPVENVARISAFSNGSGQGRLSFLTKGSSGLLDRLFIDESGLVGIGNTSPQGNLHVSSTGNTRVGISSGTGSVSALAFGSNATLGNGHIRYDDNTNSMTFGTNGSSDRIFINSGGQVGLNTNNVGAFHLNVYGPTNFSSLRLFHSASTTLGFVLGTNAAGISILNYETSPMYFGNGGVNLMSLQANGELRVGNNTSTFANSGLLVSRQGTFDNRLTITGGDNSNTYGGILTFAENLNQVAGMSIRLDAGGNRMWFTSDMAGTSPVMSVGGYGTSNAGVAIGAAYAAVNAPVNGLIVQSNLGVNTNNVLYRAHFEETTSLSAVLYAENKYAISSDGVGIIGRSVNNTGWGYGGQFYGGYHGIYANASGNSTVYTGPTYGVRADAYNQGGLNYGVSSFASGGTTAYGIYAGASGAITNYAGYFNGNVHVTGVLSKALGAFKIDHPLDPANKFLVHSFVESPDMLNIYNGNVTTDFNGYATVQLPSYFEAANMDFKYQLTVIGQFAQAIVSRELSNNAFEIRTDKPNVKVSWQITGVRNDEVARRYRIEPEVNKDVNEQGKYLNPEVYGQPASSGIGVPPQETGRSGGARR